MGWVLNCVLRHISLLPDQYFQSKSIDFIFKAIRIIFFFRCQRTLAIPRVYDQKGKLKKFWEFRLNLFKEFAQHFFLLFLMVSQENVLCKGRAGVEETGEMAI